MKRVSDLTKKDWDAVWVTNVYEFFNYVNFDIEYRKEEEREVERWRQNH